MNPLTRTALGAAIAAGAMYFFDPVSGRRRRLLVEDQCARTARRLELGTRDARHELSHRVHDLAAKAHLTREAVSDRKLGKDVRRAIKRSVTHPESISSRVREGNVFLRGDVLTSQHQDLLDEARTVPGVRIITDHLTPREAGEGVRPLHGKAAGDGWSIAGRVFVGATGCALLVWGIKERKAIASSGRTIWRRAEEALEDLAHTFDSAARESGTELHEALDSAHDIAQEALARGQQAHSATKDAMRSRAVN